ncbi:MAG TPA: hypothetical protein VLK25_08535 [Allosphingosinicella sp.]|nr:hypothetical protein [Allosphingosinicella sp.]
MIGKLVGAHLGQKIARRHSGWKGALIGAATPWLLRRAFTPLGVAAMGAWGAKRLWDRHRAQRAAAEIPAARI